MFQRTLLLRYLRLVRKYLAILGVDGGVMLMSSGESPSILLDTHSILDTGSNTGITGAEYRVW